MSKRKSTSRAKVSKKEWIYMWKEHFKKLLEKSPKVTDKPIMKINNNQLDIKLGQFSQGEFNIVPTKTKNRKTASLDEIHPEIWKTRKFDDLLLRYCTAVYNQNTIERRTKGCILLSTRNVTSELPRTTKI